MFFAGIRYACPITVYLSATMNSMNCCTFLFHKEAVLVSVACCYYILFLPPPPPAPRARSSIVVVSSIIVVIAVLMPMSNAVRMRGGFMCQRIAL